LPHGCVVGAANVDTLLVTPIVEVAIVCLKIGSLSRKRIDIQRVCAFHMRHGASLTCGYDPCRGTIAAVTAGVDKADIIGKVKLGRVVSEVWIHTWPGPTRE
jgi:hypothetical protein